MGNRNYVGASKDLISFFRQYAQLVELQIQSVHGGMTSAVNKIMECIDQISQMSQKNKELAEKTMLEAHLEPDDKSKKAMQAAQAAIDDILNMVENPGLSDLEISKDNLSNSIDHANTRRRSGRFSKSVEALSGVAGDYVKTLKQIMGILSAEDVIVQRIKHVSIAMSAIEKELAYFDRDFETKFNNSNIEKFSEKIKTTTMKQFTQSEEQFIFDKTFNKAFDELKKAFSGHQECRDPYIFLLFIQCFSILMRKQMQAVKDGISDALSKAMMGIMEINSVADKKKQHANAILVRKKGETNSFEVKDVEKVAQEEGMQKGDLKGHTELLNRPAEILAKMDADISNFVMTMMGELSIEDVIGQQLDHVIAAIAAQEKLIEIVLSN
ncbi:MAG: hypothetical protein KBD78_11295, partial [Oligoflexales bacterium]|nr:hypothetical protein [Oligoflexales bacterium]